MLIKRSFCYLLLNLTIASAIAQSNIVGSEINNLVLPANYATSALNAVPYFVKAGKKSKPAMIVIPGLGFDATVFSDFIEAHKDQYRIYTITIPGFGNSQAPPAPSPTTSFGEQTWTNSVVNGIVKLIDEEKLDRPVVVGHFVLGTQLALRLAIEHPDKVGGVIILGGVSKFVAIVDNQPVEYPLASTIKYIDNYTGPKWFGPMEKGTFDSGNYLPGIYSLDSLRGLQLWRQVARVPLPIMVRYLCEFYASDVTLDLDQLKCPLLVLYPSFGETILKMQVNNYVLPQFVEGWEKLKTKYTSINIKQIDGASAFVWKDNPGQTYLEIRNFIRAAKE